MYMTKKSFYYNTWIVALIATIATFLYLVLGGQVSLMALYELEVANSDAALKSVMTQFALNDVIMEKSIYSDYIYIVCYTTLFYLSLKVVMYSERFKKRSFLGIFTILPGFLDTLQNLLALEIVNHSGLGTHFSAYVIAVWTKWVTLIPFILLVIYAFKIQIERLSTKTAATTEKDNEAIL